MQRTLHLTRLLAVAVLFIAPAPDGHSAEQLDFGVFDNEPRLAAWLDLAPLVSSTRVDNIRDGIDLVIDFQLTLKRPRRLWGAETVEVKGGTVRIGYRIVTEDFVLQTGGKDFQQSGRFATLAGMHRFLADSVVIDLTDYARLDSLSRYYLNLELTCISMTGYTLAPRSDSLRNDESALEYLFRHFLKLTGFGRESFSGRTLPFSPAEVRRK